MGKRIEGVDSVGQRGIAGLIQNGMLFLIIYRKIEFTQRTFHKELCCFPWVGVTAAQHACFFQIKKGDAAGSQSIGTVIIEKSAAAGTCENQHIIWHGRKGITDMRIYATLIACPDQMEGRRCLFGNGWEGNGTGNGFWCVCVKLVIMNVRRQICFKIHNNISFLNFKVKIR